MGTEGYFAIVLGVVGLVGIAYMIGNVRGWSRGFDDAEKIWSKSADDRVALYCNAYKDISAKYAELLKKHSPV